MLKQTFTDFEFIIIDDGSSDGSRAILESQQDDRIVLLKNEGNRGLVYTLQRGLEVATGRYIARMDGDDVSLPDRLSKQVDYMTTHPEADLVCCVVSLIDEDGRDIGVWPDDRAHLTPASIRSFLPKNNSIAHPTVLAKADIFRSLGYRAEQREAEDYDLWLRWACAGYSLHKLGEPLVLHRIRRGSFTRLRQRNVWLKIAATKRRFCAHELSSGRFNMFTFTVLLMSVTDTIKGLLKNAVSKIRSG